MIKPAHKMHARSLPNAGSTGDAPLTHALAVANLGVEQRICPQHTEQAGLPYSFSFLEQLHFGESAGDISCDFAHDELLVGWDWCR